MNRDHDFLEMVSKEQPSNGYAEVSVIGGLILDNDRWDDLVQLLTPDDFFFPAHRIMFQAMAELTEKNTPYDLLTLTDLLAHQGRLDSVGGFAYVAEVCKNTPSAANIVEYARMVAEKSQLRQLLALGNSLRADVFQPNVQAETLIEQAESQLFSLAEKGAARQQQAVTLLQGAEALISHLERIQGSNGITGTPTGFQALDEMTCGLQPGTLSCWPPVLPWGKPHWGWPVVSVRCDIKTMRWYRFSAWKCRLHN